jgi:hypothetical protein
MRGLRLAATAAIVVLAAECASPAQGHTQYYPMNLSCAAGYDMQKGAYDSSVSNIYITIDAAGWRRGGRVLWGRQDHAHDADAGAEGQEAKSYKSPSVSDAVHIWASNS